MFLFINILLLIFVIFLLILLSMVWPPDSPWSPWWRTSKKVARFAYKIAGIKKEDNVYELGSGDGTFLITCAKEIGANCIGIEIDPVRVFISRLLIKKNKVDDKVKIIKNNFNKVNISKADFVFVYLVPRALERLKPKLLKELRSGAKVISFRYKISLPLIKEDKKNQIYLYKIS